MFLKENETLQSLAEAFAQAQRELSALRNEARPELLAKVLEVEDTGGDVQPLRQDLKDLDLDIELLEKKLHGLLQKMEAEVQRGLNEKIEAFDKTTGDIRRIRKDLCRRMGNGIADLVDIAQVLWILDGPFLPAGNHVNLAPMFDLIFQQIDVLARSRKATDYAEIAEAFDESRGRLDPEEYKTLIDDFRTVKQVVDYPGSGRPRYVQQAVSTAIRKAGGQMPKKSKPEPDAFPVYITQKEGSPHVSAK